MPKQSYRHRYGHINNLCTLFSGPTSSLAKSVGMTVFLQMLFYDVLGRITEVALALADCTGRLHALAGRSWV